MHGACKSKLGYQLALLDLKLLTFLTLAGNVRLTDLERLGFATLNKFIEYRVRSFGV